MFVECKTCNGARKIMGIGMMLKDCHHCNGTGVVQLTDSMVTNKSGNVVPVVAKRKPGRPKRLESLSNV